MIKLKSILLILMLILFVTSLYFVYAEKIDNQQPIVADAYTILLGTNSSSGMSQAFGVGNFLIDMNSNRLLFNIVYYGLEGSETAATLSGTNLSSCIDQDCKNIDIFDLPNTNGYKTGVWNYPQSLESDIMKGKIYITIYSDKYPYGEITGYIYPVSHQPETKSISSIIQPVVKNAEFTLLKSKDPNFDYKISILNYQFIPNNLKINVGDTVKWTNSDTVTHTITSDYGNELASPLLKKGNEYVHKFNTPGTYNYYCKRYKFMKGTIIVKP